ncbi:type VI secretion system tip protein VgrG [Klebsiella pneumoniae]|nr:type VI secretion system tip protein VgrG [Klebsiella pneumoniae]HBQ6110570.1 type VI secretion system tip protein VgrG [Klebsiella pneumoniae subsp. pneumoniae]MBL1549457.1 type VI secretion system tip protein VgrG [Klebsiella pneumoniae]MBL1578861.1 type VI secretion system tip protein VgrG [Klebsiella pneumoniae]MBL1801722.1 type VI secretion system tip protein VgrG [Klebsiella pneumoniae]MBL1965808.1 type VI secretion system tip protein VgrG [Klebsiella pneumoniae]
MDTSSIITGTTLNRYQLDIPSCTASLDVEEFSGAEKLSELYYYTITFTSAEKNIDAAQLLSKPAMLTMGGGALQQLADCKRVHGVITTFRRVNRSEDQSTYQITLQPFLSLLDKQFRSHRFFVNKSVPEVVEQVLQEHHLHDWEYEFNFKQHYPRREQINQYQESDLAFIQRLLAEVGIFYFFTLQEEAQSEVVHFADAQRALMFDKTLPVNSPSGMSDSGAESIWGLSITHNVVEANVTTRDYNPRDAQSVLQSATADMTRGNGEGLTYGEVYHYKLRHRERGDKIDPQTETANFYARLDHERFLAHQTLITAISTAAWLAPAQVLTVTDSLPSTLPAPVQDPLLITGTGFTASRREALRVSLLAVPYSETLCWRPPLLPRPKVTGTMTARVTSAKANDIYAWQDASGLYRVKFDPDRDEKGQGQESMPVRLAKPYGGDVYGFHFPLIQGTEVAIAFHEGDPDRPYIAHALHDSRHVDPVRFRIEEDPESGELVSRSYEVGEKSGLDRVRVRFAKQLDKETWGFEDPSIKGTFVWSRSAGQGRFEWGASQTTVHDGSAGGSTTPPTPIPEPRSVWGLPNPAPASLPPVPGTPIPEEQGPNIETLPIEDRDFNDFIIVDPMGGVPAIYVYFQKASVRDLEVDYYGNFEGRSRQGLYEVDHIPSKEAVRIYLKGTYPNLKDDIIEQMTDRVAAVAIPIEVHRQCSETYGGKNNSKFRTQDGGLVTQKVLDASNLEAAVDANWDANAECLRNEYGVSDEKIEEIRAKLHELNRKAGLY